MTLDPSFRRVSVMLTGLLMRCRGVMLAAGLIGFCILAQAADSGLQVLIINSYDESTEPYLYPKNVFMSEFQKYFTTPVAFRQFDLDQRAGTEEGYAELKMRLLEFEYAIKPPDLVVAMGPPATSFWLELRGPFFAKAPFIALASDVTLAGMNFQPGDTVVATRFSFRETVEDFLHIQPDTSHILMVFGASPFEERLASLAQQQLEGLSAKVRFEYTNRMKLGALKDRLARLPPGSAVFIGIFESDPDGVALNNYAGLTLVRASSPVPVIGVFEDQLGRGILGGRLVQLGEIGREMATTAREILHKRPTDVAWKLIEMSAPTYDWRELQAWGIEPKRLPPGSVIRFKPPTVWEMYSGWITLTALIIAAQVALIVSLVLQHRHRQRAELQGIRLGRRLLSAQEDERRTLARELHDDLSQRLARLAIDAAYVAANPGSAKSIEVLQGLQPELVSISKDVHDMSYRLHPSLIKDLGLGAALQTECEKAQRHTNAAIVVQLGAVREKIPADTALCVYRITQEAVHNAIKYADASSIEVTLEQRGEALALSVRDNGKGFDPGGEDQRAGLGLVSMRERAQLAGGSWAIQSQPGKGTTVTAVLPLKGAPG